jgi:hypothetical protein
LGKWSAPMPGWNDDNCLLNISKNGTSFVIVAEKHGQGACSSYTGLYTLTPEGNLKGGPMDMVAFSYDKQSDRVMCSSNGVVYLKKR